MVCISLINFLSICYCTKVQTSVRIRWSYNEAASRVERHLSKKAVLADVTGHPKSPAPHWTAGRLVQSKVKFHEIRSCDESTL